ncbi:MAG: hypothetical protein EHM53_11140 [Methanoregulaceae archaeon]|nr:MAG: hypothetical protein EHM53_11140 [Methanoregulaceae archaeon]
MGSRSRVTIWAPLYDCHVQRKTKVYRRLFYKKDNSPFWVLSLQFPEKRKKERMVHPEIREKGALEKTFKNSDVLGSMQSCPRRCGIPIMGY